MILSSSQPTAPPCGVGPKDGFRCALRWKEFADYSPGLTGRIITAAFSSNPRGNTPRTLLEFYSSEYNVESDRPFLEIFYVE